jgi:imidazolonepropionase-like amidohydrolase
VDLAVVAVLGLIVTPAVAQDAGQSWAVSGATMIDGTGAAPLADSIVVGRGERITCVGPSSQCAVPDAARVTRAVGQWLIPGLIDAHVHLNWANEAAPRRQRLRFAFGITTTRDAGVNGVQLEQHVIRRREAERPGAPEPRLVVTALIPAGQRSIASVDLVRGVIAIGAQAIKIKDELAPDELDAIVTAAHAAGVQVYGHTWTVRGSQLERALAAGIDGVSHMATFASYGLQKNSARPEQPVDEVEVWVWDREMWNYQDQSRLSTAVDLVAARRAWVEPLLVADRYITLPSPLPRNQMYLEGLGSTSRSMRPWVPFGRYGWPAIRDRDVRLEAVFARMCEVVAQLHERGVMIVAGTDNVQPGRMLIEEIELLGRCGLGPMSALQTATRNAAIAIGRPDIGTIESGKLADLVILDADPLKDPANLFRVSQVIKGGDVHDQRAVVAPFVREYRTQVLAVVMAVLALGLVVVWRVSLSRKRRRHRRPDALVSR